MLGAEHAHSLKRYRGHVGASLIVGGVDFTGPQLYSVHPHGSYSRLPFAALGELFLPLPTNPSRATLASCSSRDAMATTDLRCPSYLQVPARMLLWRYWRIGSRRT